MDTFLCPGYRTSAYKLFFSEKNSADDFFEILPSAHKYFVIYDTTFATHHKSFMNLFLKLPHYLIPIDSNEKNKSFSCLEKLLKLIYKQQPTNDDLIIVIGGGLVLNIGGLSASLTMRGMRYCFIPTTFTAQIDAGIGSKQAVNFLSTKNWIGMYNDQLFSYINTTFLRTLPHDEFVSESLEAIKIALAYDKALYLKMDNNLGNIERNPYETLQKYAKELIKLKIRIIKKDLLEYSWGGGMLYGHTIGHAIETASHYGVSHGTAIGLGMLFASKISNQLEICDRSLVTLHESILERLKLSKKQSSISKRKIVSQMFHNKKNTANGVTFYLLKDIGELYFKAPNIYAIEVPQQLIINTLQHFYE